MQGLPDQFRPDVLDPEQHERAGPVDSRTASSLSSSTSINLFVTTSRISDCRVLDSLVTTDQKEGRLSLTEKPSYDQCASSLALILGRPGTGVSGPDPIGRNLEGGPFDIEAVRLLGPPNVVVVRPAWEPHDA